MRERVLAGSALGELRRLTWLWERAKVPVLAAEAAVGVTRDAGRRTDRVGDFELDFVLGES